MRICTRQLRRAEAALRGARFGRTIDTAAMTKVREILTLVRTDAGLLLDAGIIAPYVMATLRLVVQDDTMWAALCSIRNDTVRKCATIGKKGIS